jgi:hypothetical protein
MRLIAARLAAAHVAVAQVVHDTWLHHSTRNVMEFGTMVMRQATRRIEELLRDSTSLDEFIAKAVASVNLEP